MLPLIPIKGFYLSEKRKQIIKINHFVNSINLYKNTEPEKAEPFINELYAFQKELMEKKSVAEPVLRWFSANPARKIHRLIREKIREKSLVTQLSGLLEKTRMTDIYYQYTGADSFRNLSQQRLETIGDGYRVLSLNQGKAPLVRVINEDNESFVMGLLQLNSREGASVGFTHELLTDLSRIVYPYLLTFIEDDDHETCFLHCCKYYKNGNLGNLFKRLKQQGASKVELGYLLLVYTQQLLEFFIAINHKGLWYTNLKPSKILLDSNDNLVINDLKGFVTSSTRKTLNLRPHTSKEYYSSAVYDKDHRINLAYLQRQTLANTLYQLACGQLPIQNKTHDDKWETSYEFNQAIFQNRIGDYLKNLIRLLAMKKAVPMTKLVEEINGFLANRQNYNQRLVGPKASIHYVRN